MKSINLIFGCHSHQPIGNFDDVFRMAYDKAYLPFVEVLERYPAVRVTLHYTGPLWDWFEANTPEYIARLKTLVDAGQVEIMGGGYYEPLLCSIPERDAIAQVHRMNEVCKRHFGHTPRGFWLAERVWEPHMPSVIKKAGPEYVAVDDAHFLCAGHPQEDLFGYYVTEDQGYSVKVFPILERLRYLIPFHPVHETIDFLRDAATEDGLRCAVIHDDGEKFGVWPETYHSVYEEGWLEELFQALTDNQEWLHSVTYSDYLAKAPALGKTYLPTASYHEMMEWALPTGMQHRMKDFLAATERVPECAADAKLFVRGGFWRSFFAKYPESNNMNKKMLRVSEKLYRLQEMGPSVVADAERLLHEGQCNCAYWHGVFGGLYLNHLRTAVYEKLIEAERILDGLSHADDNWVECEAVDFDADGFDEAVLENAQLSLTFSAKDGGTLFEFDYRNKPFNFGNTLTRREEPYHEVLRRGEVNVGETGKGDQSIHELARAKEAGLENYLVYDPYRRVSLRDHFLTEHETAQQLWAGTHRELGDFATSVYHLETGADTVVLTRDGHVWSDERAYPVRVQKTITLAPRASSFEIRYDLLNNDSVPLRVWFGTELAVNLLTGSSFDRYYRSDERDMGYAKLGEMGRDDDLGHLALRDDWQRLECGFRFNQPARIYRFGIETVSQSENGQERVYQGSIVVPCWYVECAPGSSATRTIVIGVSST